jgi:hypothetical protein
VHSEELKRTGEILRRGVSSQVEDYSSRFNLLAGLYEGFLKDKIRSKWDLVDASRLAEEFFGSRRIRFAGVDGTEYKNGMFDLVVFYGGSYAAKGSIDLDGLKVEFEPRLVEEGLGVSSCIPLYVNQIVELDQTLVEVGEGGEVTSERQFSDEEVVSNSQIANAVMTLSEFYLAYKIASGDDHPNLLLMDRSLSTMLGSLMYDTRERKLWDISSFIGFEVDGQSVDRNDILYNRHRVINQDLMIPSPRGDGLRYSIAYLIESEGPLNIEEICKELGIEDVDRKDRVERFLDSSVKEGYLRKRGDKFSVAPVYERSWDRVKSATVSLCRRVFEEGDVENPLHLGEDRWLTVLDISFLTLFIYLMLIEECWRKNILLVGITKDTTARDFKTHLMPVMVAEGLWKPSLEEELRRAPDTDRVMLQYVSAMNHGEMVIPWALPEYDTAFRMIIPELGKRHRGYVSGAILNRVLYERIFLKTYVQLSQAVSDPQLRSNVLFIDRLAYPAYDYRPDTVSRFTHRYGGADEPLEVIVYRDGGVENRVQNLVMVLLGALSRSSIPEVFGHNLPLFMADKVAKWHYAEAQRIIDSTRLWVSNDRRLRRQLFFIGSFRERRSEFEQGRR